MSETCSQTRKDNSRSALQLINALETAEQFIHIPNDYTLIKVDYVEQQDATPVWSFRYEKIHTSSNDSLDGENYTFVVNASTYQVKSITYTDAELASGELLDIKDSYRLAMSFLKKVAPDLMSTLELLWIEPYNVTIAVTTSQGKENVIIPGIAVEYLQKNLGAYTWVIIGTNGRVISFERDISRSKLSLSTSFSRTSDASCHGSSLALPGRHDNTLQTSLERSITPLTNF